MPRPIRVEDSGPSGQVVFLKAAWYPALTATHTNYTFNAIRFPLTDGARFGVRATIISPLGIPSPTFEATRLQVFV